MHRFLRTSINTPIYTASRPSSTPLSPPSRESTIALWKSFSCLYFLSFPSLTPDFMVVQPGAVSYTIHVVVVAMFTLPFSFHFLPSV